MNFADLRTATLWLFGVTTAAGANANVRQDAALSVNRALQTLQLAGDDYFTRQTLPISLNVNQGAFALDQSIQNVIGPVRIQGGAPLRMLSTRTQYDLYTQLFLPDGQDTLPAGSPEAYFLERTRTATISADNSLITLRVLPAPAAATTLELEAVLKPVAYPASQFALDYNGTAPADPPVPHAYAESLLMPLVNYYAMASRYFAQPERAEYFEREYARAMLTLGGADPQTASVEPSDKARATQAARQAARAAYQNALAK